MPTVHDAIQAMLQARSENRWFHDVYWPENEQRFRRIIEDVTSHAPAPSTVLDIGCFDGFFCEVLAHLGYQVRGTDQMESEGRDKRFAQLGIEFFPSNLNDDRPLAHLADGTFDAVVMGEVIEHVLHHPRGLLDEVRRVLRPQGRLILTTPNPSTIMNAVRALSGSQLMWGDEEFADLPKLSADARIHVAHVHYREYSPRSMQQLLARAGFNLVRTDFMPIGASRQQSRFKRIVKQAPVVRTVAKLRPFACTAYYVAHPSV